MKRGRERSTGNDGRERFIGQSRNSFPGALTPAGFMSIVPCGVVVLKRWPRSFLVLFVVLIQVGCELIALLDSVNGSIHSYSPLCPVHLTLLRVLSLLSSRV